MQSDSVQVDRQRDISVGIDSDSDVVLITGAAGNVGSALRTGLGAQWRKLRLMDNRPIAAPADNEEAILCDMSDRAALNRVMAGVTAVVHLAGSVRIAGEPEAMFEANGGGLFNVFEAARRAGVRRIVYASSNHAFGYYPVEERVSPADIARPDSLYGVLKIFGETLLRYYFDRHGIRSVSLRIGSAMPRPNNQRSLATWLSPADLAQLVDRSLRHPDPGCLVVNGYSRNRRLNVSDVGWEFLGYRPKDDAEEYVEALRSMGVEVAGKLEWPLHGGQFVRTGE
jgi:uronate dehydrogenase